jgi:hypothetical protein
MQMKLQKVNLSSGLEKVDNSQKLKAQKKRHSHQKTKGQADALEGLGVDW